MCGLVAVFSTELNTYQHSYGKFFKEALFADTLRGADSTGIFVMDTAKMQQPEVYKKAMAAPDFLQLARTNELLRSNADWNMMVGHNRHATKGGVFHHTAHPFQIGNITMVHNGTINNHRSLPDCHKYDVDSEAICHAIDDIGIEEVVRRIDGAFAFIWHDQRNGSINFIRNEERPLAFGKVKDKNTLLMASEANMLRWLALRNGLSLESIMEPKPGELFVYWPYRDNKDWISKPDVKKLELKAKNVYHNYGNGYQYDNFSRGTEVAGKKHLPVASGVSGKTTSKTKRQTSTEPKAGEPLLESLGLTTGEEVCIVQTRWEAYPNSKNNMTGRVIGKIEDLKDQHMAILHGIDRPLWEGTLKGCMIYSTILSATIDSHKIPNIFLNNQDYCILEPDDLPNHTVIGQDEEEESLNDETSEEENRALKLTYFRGFRGQNLTLREFEVATKEGCCHCGGNIDPADHEKTGWTHDRQPVCKDCIRDFDLGEYLH